MDSKTAAGNVWTAFRSRDRDSICSVLSDDVEWIAPRDNATAVALGVTDHMVGKEAIADFILNDLPKLFSQGISIVPISITAEGNRVVFEQVQRATLTGGRHYENTYVFILEMDGLKARRIREYMDTQAGYRMVFPDGPPDSGANLPT